MERMERAIWRHEMRGGYGYVEDVPVLIVRRTAKRVRVLAQTRAGYVVERQVSPDRVREPTAVDLRTHAGVFAGLDPEPSPPPTHAAGGRWQTRTDGGQ